MPALTVTAAPLAVSDVARFKTTTLPVPPELLNLTVRGQNRSRRQGQGRALGGAHVLDAAGVAGEDQDRDAAGAGGQRDGGVGRGDYVAAELTLPPLSTFFTVIFQGEAQGTDRVGPARSPPKSSVEPAGATMLVLGKLTGAV